MIYLITYQQANESHTMEWVVPEGWGTAAITQAFKEHFPAAALLRLDPQP